VRVSAPNHPRESLLFAGAAMNEDIFEEIVPVGDPLLETVNRNGQTSLKCPSHRVAWLLNLLWL